ncbi:MAG: PAS domain S-box protein [Deltaproteobacteria bacterium]|nr:PAS domain S-box protein [Deltaproteobacteria bacterium]
MLAQEYVFSMDPRNVFYRCVEDCSEAIMITDLAGCLLYVNPAWCRIYGYTREEAIGKTPKLLHSGYHTPEFYRGMWRAIQNPAIGHWKGEVVNRTKNGNLIPVLLSITPARDAENRIVGHMGIALDVSNEKQLEATVLQQDRLASIGVLASGLAHEVGTPLGVVRGRAEFLMMQAANQSPSLVSGLQTIVTQIDRISKLINSLLRFSRSTDDVRKQDITVKSVVDEVANLLGQNLRAASIELKLEVPAGQRVFADFNRLQQIIVNLVVNSVHAIEKAVSEGARRDHSITIRSEPWNTCHVAISVVDTGCGIAPENLNKIFQPFFTTKDIGQGTGLGLAIVSKLVHELGGEITVDSVPGNGAKFTLLLKTTK